MSIDRIRQAILDEAREEAAAIESEAEQRREREFSAAKARIEDEFKHRLELGSQAAERDANQKQMQARAKHSLALLQRRNELLDEIFAKAAKAVAELPDEQYRRSVAAWMKNVPGDVAGEVLCARKDADRIEPLIEELNAQRPEDARLSLAPGDEPRIGGVIFRTDRYEMDLSLDSRLERMREEMAPQIAADVFAKQTTL